MTTDPLPDTDTAEPPAYEPPRLERLGTLAEATRGPGHGAHADGLGFTPLAMHASA